MKLKNIPAGNYTKIRAVYVPLIDSFGTCCANCGRLIANLVTVKNEDNGATYIIGQDCAKTLFSPEINKQIDREIKEGVKRKKAEADQARRKKWDDAYKIYQERMNTAGVTNENINSEWAKKIHNDTRTQVEIETGITIGYPR